MQPCSGYFVSLDPRKRAKEIAELFCGLDSGEQATFFNEVAIVSRRWESSRTFQWRDIQRYLSEDGKRVIDELSEHTSDEDRPTGPRTVCAFCGTWRSRPCGEACEWGIEKEPVGCGFVATSAKG